MTTCIRRDDLTVVVPTKNEHANIERFLGSVPADVHLVVVDASTDDTPEIVERLRPEATVIRARTNIPEARQIGAVVASTRWLLYTDADVVFGPRYFEVLEHLRITDDTGGIAGTKTMIEGFDHYHRWFKRGQILLDAVGIPAATGSNMLVRADVLDAAGGFDPNLSVNEDTELMFRIRRAGFRVPLVTDLMVANFDPRRLEMGLARKMAHGVVRNVALYFGWFDRTVRAGDWGYWDTDADNDAAPRRDEHRAGR